jgi:hypothetical protein
MHVNHRQVVCACLEFIERSLSVANYVAAITRALKRHSGNQLIGAVVFGYQDKSSHRWGVWFNNRLVLREELRR